MDGIYPHYQCFVQAVKNPATRKERIFSTQQEAARKEVERAFGMLQARWHIIERPCRLWHREAMKTVMKACVLLHNMILDYQRDQNIDGSYIDVDLYRAAHPFTVTRLTESERLSISNRDRERTMTELKNTAKHNQLQEDLMQHMLDRWNAGLI